MQALLQFAVRHRCATDDTPRVVMPLLVYVFLGSVAFGSPLISRKADDVWRDGQHGGLNCLVLLSHIYEREDSYDDFATSLAGERLPETVSDLLFLAKRCDFPLEARSLSPTDLDTLRLPVLVHLDGDETSKGIFNVLLGISDARVLYMEGPAAAVLSMDKELFLRRWTGVAVFPRESAPFPTVYASAAAGVTIAMSSCWISRHVRRYRGT